MSIELLRYLPAPVRRGLYFGLQWGIGSHVWRNWREFCCWERLSRPELNRRVGIRLNALLEGAVQRSGYYRSLGVEQRQSGETAVDWLRRFPVLGRETVRERFLDLVVDDLRGQILGPDSVSPRRYDWVAVKTGGSTGVPTTVVHDRGGRDSGRATRLYALKLAGFPLGTPYFRLWGSEQDLLRQKTSLQQRLLQSLHGEVPMNAFRSKRADLERHYQVMVGLPRVRHMMAYVDAASSLADFIECQKLRRVALEGIMACAGTVTAQHREQLRGTFGSAVVDKYGSRECSDMASQCLHQRGLHVFSPHVFLEVVDERGQGCPPGEPGRILVTLLQNHGFPMIRYDIGDLGTWEDEGAACDCGSPFPLLRAVEGRQDDMLVTEDGTKLTSVFVRHFVGVSLNRQLISEWQLEQVARGEFVFRYVPAARDGLEKNLRQLVASFMEAFGSTSRIECREVESIPPSPTGKVRWIINTMR